MAPSPDTGQLEGSDFPGERAWRLLPAWPPPEARIALLDEAQAYRARAERSESVAPDRGEERGGDPPRAFASVVGGPAQEALYQAPDLRGRLERALRTAFRPSAERGTYSYYENPADHLGIHRDVVDCDATVLTCLRDEADPGRECGALCMWPQHSNSSLAEVRVAPDLNPVYLRLAVGESLVLLGGVIPHAVLPVVPSQGLILSVLCFRFETGPRVE